MKDQRAREARRYMQSIALTDRLIDSKLVEITRLRLKAQIASSSTDGERVKESGYPVNRLQEIVIKITEMQEEVDRQIDALADKRNAAVQMLEKLDDQRERIILEERYWNGKSWDDIMEELHFERSQSFRMHNSALVHLYELIHGDD